MRRLRRVDLFFLNAYFFGLSFLWNGLLVILLPVLLLRFVPAAWKNTYLGVLSMAGLSLAMVIQPLSGHLSDGTASRWGRRRPWILAGTLGDFVCLALMGLAGSYPALLLSYLLLQVASNTAHGPAFGLIPDLVPPERRGTASGAKNLADILGLMAGGFIAGWMVDRRSAEEGLAAIGLVLGLALLTTLLGVREEPILSRRPPTSPKTTLLATLKGAFHLDWTHHGAYGWLLISRLVMLTAITPVQGFAQYYVQDFLNVPNPAGATGRMMAVIGLSVLVVVVPAGWLSDRWSPWSLNALAGVTAGIGIAGMALVRTYDQALALASCIGLAMGIFVSANWTLATRLVPREAGGRYLGLSNLATGGAGVLGRLAGPMVDAVNWVCPDGGYLALFAFSSCLMFAGTALLLRARRAAPSP